MTWNKTIRGGRQTFHLKNWADACRVWAFHNVFVFHYWRATDKVKMKQIYLILIRCYFSSLTSAMVYNNCDFEGFLAAWKMFRYKVHFEKYKKTSRSYNLAVGGKKDSTSICDFTTSLNRGFSKDKASSSGSIQNTATLPDPWPERGKTHCSRLHFLPVTSQQQFCPEIISISGNFAL